MPHSGEDGASVARVGEHVHDAGVRARREDELASALDEHRHEAFVHDPRIGLPRLAVGGALDVAGQPLLVGRHAGNLTADAEDVADEQLRLARVHDAGAGGGQLLRRWQPLLDEQHAVRPLRAPLAEHPRVHDARHGATALAHRRDGGLEPTAVIPVAVRQHDGLDLAEVDAENGRILRQRRAGRTGVEQQRVSLALDVRGEEQRQAVVRATDHLARE